MSETTETNGAAQLSKLPQFNVRYADTSLLRTNFPGSIETIVEIKEALGEITVVAKREGLLSLLTYLRDEPKLRFNYLSDIGGVDLGEFAEPRFAVAYQLYSLDLNHRLRVKVLLNEDDATLPSACGIWKAANWLEREIYDMFGVNFENHPDLRRILMPADYEGHPLRKDFPLKGY
jgi:NADH-quinone oxidoreductase subunit C